mmetsp:Transcript_21291/g.53640  ORF Transcript_21291/g.53640 Transcript_21291/m.53640 type:complete len:232 (+) Transcript_21291:457-1152(+)
MRSLLPLSTPGGIVIMSCLDFCTRPRPAHVPQYSSTIWPVPEHVWQAPCCCIIPMGVRTTCVTTPDPPQVPQVRGLVPGFIPSPEQVPQVSRWEIWTFSSPPKMAFSKSISRSRRRSSPCIGPCCLRRPPAPPWPPKKVSKMSPNGEKSPKSWNPAPPPPNPPPLTPASPNWSYIDFFWGSERTSYAFWISWNCLMASGALLTSGWSFLAFCLKAFLISSASAPFLIPSCA